jgi:uncharacterized RDD family membrane protein YckC
MNTLKRLLAGLIPILLCGLSGVALAQAQTVESESNSDSDSDQAVQPHHPHHSHHSHHDSNGDDDIVSIGSEAHLSAGNHADSVVGLLAPAISEGTAGDVVSVFGETRVTGPVKEDAVAVLGNNYIDSKVDGDAVAVLGDLELGPHAEIGGDAVTVGGTLTRDPAAIVHGQVQSVLVSHVTAHFQWLRAWASHCLLYGRPLAIAPGLGWAWIMALSFLALYVLLALIFPGPLTLCAQTFETHPGQSLVSSLLGALLSPIVIVVLCITVIGIAIIPFVVVGLFCAGLFGKAAMLAWVGRRCLSRSQGGLASSPALAVLIGGAIVLLLYLIPVVGFVVYKLLSFLGFGVVLLALLQTVRKRQAEASIPASAGATTETGSPTMASSIGAAAVPGAGASSQAEIGVAPAAEPLAAAAPAAPAVTGVSLTALPRAGFWIRMVALLIDVVLVGIVLSVLHHAQNLELVALAAYGAVMWKLRGSTIGGIVFDLQVVRHDGREMDWATAIVRAVGCLLSLAAVGIGFLWIAFDSGKLAWHDKIAGTIVVRASKRISLV